MLKEKTDSYITKNIICHNGEKKIYGVAYIPDINRKIPLVIMSHGLAGTHDNCTAYAKCLADMGIASYTFDFCGGGKDSQSDGKTTEMSVMTEVTDLEAVLESAKTWDFVDNSKIVAFGESQGGIVSAITAARHADAFAGLILLYPAFLINNDIHRDYNSLDEVESVFNLMGIITVGKNYVSDMWDYDVYAEIGNYKKQTLIIHGSDDKIVDVSYSERAEKTYDDARLYVINGAGHGFWGSTFEESIEYITSYLKDISVLEN